MRKLKNRAIFGAMATVLGPTIFWVFSQLFYGYITMDEFLKSLIPPQLWMLYVILYCVILYLYMNKKLKIIIDFQQGKETYTVEEVQKILARLPRFIIAAVVVFCVVGPVTFILPLGYYSNAKFLLSEILASAMIFSLSVPAFLITVGSIEKLSANIPLSKKYRFMNMRRTLAIGMIATSIGIVVMLIILNISIIISFIGSNDIGRLSMTLITKNLIIGAFAIIISIINYSITSRKINSPIHEVSSMLLDICEGEGDLSQRIHVKTRDDIGELAALFNTFIDNVHNIVKQVNNSAENVNEATTTLTSTNEVMTASTEQVTAAIVEIAQGASSQSDSLNSISNNMDSFGKEIDNVKKLIDDISDNLNITNASANKDSENLKIVGEALRDISTSFNEVVEKNRSLGEAISEVKHIVSIVGNIANQTNLLALNAAIEASRAGEMGKGFAVVAQEIRKLADQTRTSLENITELIERISKESNDAVNTTKTVREDLSQQMSSIAASMRAFKALVTSINDISPKAKNISKAVENINNAKENIIEKVNDTAAVSEETTASAEEITSSAEEIRAMMEDTNEASKSLESLTAELNNVVNRFKL